MLGYSADAKIADSKLETRNFVGNFQIPTNQIELDVPVMFMNKTYPMFFRALQILGGIVLIAQAAFAHGSFDEKRMSFTVPTAPWTMTLTAGNFVVEERRQKPDGSSGYFFLTDNTSHLNVSFYIEPVGSCKNSKACRDMVWKMGNPSWENPKNFVSSQIGDVSYFEFLIPSFRDQPVQQQNMYAEFVVEGFWIDLHISKILYKPEDHKLFEQLVKAIKFEPKPSRTASWINTRILRQRMSHA